MKIDPHRLYNTCEPKDFNLQKKDTYRASSELTMFILCAIDTISQLFESLVSRFWTMEISNMKDN